MGSNLFAKIDPDFVPVYANIAVKVFLCPCTMYTNYLKFQFSLTNLIFAENLFRETLSSIKI